MIVLQNVMKTAMNATAKKVMKTMTTVRIFWFYLISYEKLTTDLDLVVNETNSD